MDLFVEHSLARGRASRVLLATVLLAVAVTPGIRSAAQTVEPRVIEVTARRFAFEPSQIDVKLGERIRLMVVSADGPHGVEIKKFNIKKEIPRGRTPVVIEFTASEEGRFPILCSEYCGDEHDSMQGMLVVRVGEPDHQ